VSDVKQCDRCSKVEGDRDDLDWWIKVQTFGTYDYCSKECAAADIAEFDMSREELIDDPDQVPA
jgi:hypothetical protein